MPLYEYQCESCESRFEKIQKFSDPLVEVCPTCGGTVHKLPSSPAIKFKGTGWYITDYPKKSSSDAGKSGSSKGGDSHASSSSPSETTSSDKSSSDKSSSDSRTKSTDSSSSTKKTD